MSTLELSLILLIVAAIVGVVSRRVRLPYTLALLLLGLALGATGITRPLALSSQVILLLFLPPLLFEAAFRLDLRLLWARRRRSAARWSTGPPGCPGSSGCSSGR